MSPEDHTALSLKYKRECIPLYILYWDTTGYIIHAFNTHTGDEVRVGSPERALMSYTLRRVRTEEEQRIQKRNEATIKNI